MEEKIGKIYKIVIALIILVSLNLVITFVSINNTKKTTNSETNTQENEEENNEDYDVSMFDSLTLDGVLKLFEDKKSTYVVYLGRSTCSACKSFLPTLQSMQKKYGYTTKYLDITTVDGKSDSYTKLMDKLNKEVTLTVSGKTETKAYGEYFGYTPMTFIIKKGKFNAGIVGAYSESKFESFLNENGIK